MTCVNWNDRCLLVIDDDPANLLVAEDFLQPQGASVITSNCGRRGVELAKEQLPDLVLLDILMPGLDGIEVCHELKSDELTRDIPVIFMTGLSDINSKLKAFAVGGADYVTKPFHGPELLARVGVHLQLHSLQRELADKNYMLEGALDTGNVVNVAVGVLMERHGLDRAAAFESIRSQARSQRRKVRLVAEEILAG